MKHFRIHHLLPLAILGLLFSFQNCTQDGFTTLASEKFETPSSSELPSDDSSVPPLPPPPTGQVPTWVKDLPLWTWYQIPNTALSGVDPSPRPFGNTGPQSKIVAWCGATLKKLGSVYMIAASGGHADYGGNEVDALQLNSENPKWVELHGPSPDSAMLSGSHVYLDLKPTAQHTYTHTQFINSRNKLVIVSAPGMSSPRIPEGGPDWPYTEGPLNNNNLFHAFNMLTNNWDPIDTLARWPGSGDWTANLTVKHPVTEDIYYSPNRGGGWWRWSNADNTWAQLSKTTRSPWYGGYAIDPIRNRMLVIGSYYPNVLPQVYDLSGTLIPATFGGLGPTSLAVTGYPGLIYDEANDRFLAVFNSGDSIRVLRINPQTWEVDDPGMFGTPPAARPNGIHNSVQYVPELKGFVIANSHRGNVYFVRTAP